MRRKLIAILMAVSFVVVTLSASVAFAGGQVPALGSPWRYSCNKGGTDGESQGSVLMEIYLGGSTDKTPMQLVNECNEKYPAGCEGQCWACYSFSCYDLDGKCQGNACN